MVLSQGVPAAAEGGSAARFRKTRGARISADGCEHSFRIDAIAAYTSRIVYLSFAGSASTVKAIRAVINQPDVGFQLICTEYDHPFGTHYRFSRDNFGYRSYSQPLGLHTWHMVMVSKRPGLLLSMDDETIWRELSGPRFTTPVLREWMPYLLERLKEYQQGERGILECEAWGCSPGILESSAGQLDGIVEEGLKNGSLTI